MEFPKDPGEMRMGQELWEEKKGNSVAELWRRFG